MFSQEQTRSQKNLKRNMTYSSKRAMAELRHSIPMGVRAIPKTTTTVAVSPPSKIATIISYPISNPTALRFSTTLTAPGSHSLLSSPSQSSAYSRF
ncbi:hypothetical protein EV1_018478 [Malus domestica]